MSKPQTASEDAGLEPAPPSEPQTASEDAGLEQAPPSEPGSGPDPDVDDFVWEPTPEPSPTPGVLWLSDGTGAYTYLGHRGAIYINPRDPGQMARALVFGLTMTPEERRFRLGQLLSATARFDLERQLEMILEHAGLPLPSPETIDLHNGVH